MTPKKKPAKPAASGKQIASKNGKPSSDSFLGWLGRQVGHVANAVNKDVTKGAKASGPKSAAKSKAPTSARPEQSPVDPASVPPDSVNTRVIYREDKIEEAELPDRPGVKLRRTIIDEVVVEVEEKKREQ